MADLPTNYLDDILSASMGGKRRFKITHLNGTSEEVTIEDISKYDQVGSTFGAGDINKTNQAVNEKFDSDDVVDPKLATEEGFAADAKFTGDAITEIYSNLTAADSVPFRFGVDEEGKYGYIVTDEDGADSVIPFKTGDEYRLEIINALPSKFGLTEDSTWPDIIAVLNEYYPETWSILSNLTSSDWTNWKEVSGTVHSGSSSFSYTQGSKLDLYAWANVSGGYEHYAKSASFDITGYNSLVATYSSSEKGAIFFYLQTEDGNVPVVNGTTDISKYTGMANFYMCVSPGYSGSTLYSGRYTVSSLYLKE